MAISSDSVPEILHAIDLVDKAITAAQIGLNHNPSVEDERALNRILLRLNAERAVLEAELDSAMAADPGVQAPDAGQLAAIESLSSQVELATNAAIVVSDIVGLSSKVLDLASSIVGNS
jgi:hypothetical protein